MATFQDLTSTIRSELHATTTELPDSEVLLILKGVVRDLTQRGVLNDQSTDPITWVTNTYKYNIPATFIWIHHLERESEVTAANFDEWVPDWQYRFELNSGVPQVEFYKATFTQPTAGKLVRFSGQSRLIEPTALSDTVVPSIEGITQELLRVRSLSRMSMGQSELSVDRANQRREEKVLYEEILASVVASRVLPSSRRVLGR